MPRHRGRDAARGPAAAAQAPREVDVLAVDEEVVVEEARRDPRVGERLRPEQDGAAGGAEDLGGPVEPPVVAVPGADVEVPSVRGHPDPDAVEHGRRREVGPFRAEDLPGEGRDAGVLGAPGVLEERRDEAGREDDVRVQDEDPRDPPLDGLLRSIGCGRPCSRGSRATGRPRGGRARPFRTRRASRASRPRTRCRRRKRRGRGTTARKARGRAARRRGTRCASRARRGRAAVMRPPGGARSASRGRGGRGGRGPARAATSARGWSARTTGASTRRSAAPRSVAAQAAAQTGADACRSEIAELVPHVERAEVAPREGVHRDAADVRRTRGRDVADPAAALEELRAEVDVLEPRGRERRVEAAGGLEVGAPHEEGGGGRLLDVERLVAGTVEVAVAPEATGSREEAVDEEGLAEDRAEARQAAQLKLLLPVAREARRGRDDRRVGVEGREEGRERGSAPSTSAASGFRKRIVSDGAPSFAARLQAGPNPRFAPASTTRAPAARATPADPSVDALSTTTTGTPGGTDCTRPPGARRSSTTRSRRGRGGRSSGSMIVRIPVP